MRHQLSWVQTLSWQQLRLSRAVQLTQPVAAASAGPDLQAWWQLHWRQAAVAVPQRAHCHRLRRLVWLLPAALVAEQAAGEVQVVLKCPERAAGSAVQPRCRQS